MLKSLGCHPSSTGVGFCHDHLSNSNCNPNPNPTQRLPMQYDGILQLRSMEYGVKRDFLANGCDHLWSCVS